MLAAAVDILHFRLAMLSDTIYYTTVQMMLSFILFSDISLTFTLQVNLM